MSGADSGVKGFSDWCRLAQDWVFLEFNSAEYSFAWSIINNYSAICDVPFYLDA